MIYDISILFIFVECMASVSWRDVGEKWEREMLICSWRQKNNLGESLLFLPLSGFHGLDSGYQSFIESVLDTEPSSCLFFFMI